jgi:hypothetical protein
MQRRATITKLVHGNEHVGAPEKLTRQSICTLFALELDAQSFDLCARFDELLLHLIDGIASGA